MSHRDSQLLLNLFTCDAKTYSKSNEPSKYIWDLKETGINPIVKWSIVENIYSNTKLCLLEKLYIIDCIVDDNRLLNRKNELISGCRHQKEIIA